MTVIRPGCVYCGMFHDPKTCNYQLILLIESYINKQSEIDPAALAYEISKAGYTRAT
jgi:ABC-type multidrug transport system permease subunit